MVSSSTGLLIIFVNISGSKWPDSLFIFASQSVPQENEDLINPGSWRWACEPDCWFTTNLPDFQGCYTGRFCSLNLFLIWIYMLLAEFCCLLFVLISPSNICFSRLWHSSWQYLVHRPLTLWNNFLPHFLTLLALAVVATSYLHFWFYFVWQFVS